MDMNTLRALVRIYWQMGAATILLGGGVYALIQYCDADFAKWLAGGVFGAALTLVGSWNGERKASKSE
jgi:hypothetical protein